PGAMPHHDARRWRGGRSQTPLGAGREFGTGDLRLRTAEADRTHHGKGRRRLRPLRLVRGALSHLCVGHAEVRRLDSLRGKFWEYGMSRNGLERVNDFAIKLARVNG